MKPLQYLVADGEVHPQPRVLRLSLIVLLVSVAVLWASADTKTAHADSRGFTTTVGRATGYYYSGFFPFYVTVPVRADWHANASVTFTNYGSYNLLERFSHAALTEQNYTAYANHLGATIVSDIYNGYQQLRYTFRNSFGYGCYLSQYTAFQCGDQATYIWIDPNNGYVRADAVMAFYGAGWFNTGGNHFNSEWNWTWP